MMRIAWGGPLRSTPLSFRRRGETVLKEAELRTSLSIAPRSRLDFWRSLVAAGRYGAMSRRQSPRSLIPENEGTAEGRTIRIRGE